MQPSIGNGVVKKFPQKKSTPNTRELLSIGVLYDVHAEVLQVGFKTYTVKKDELPLQVRKTFVTHASIYLLFYQ
jgi:hypothetical protein